MSKFYILSENEKLYKDKNIYEDYNLALLNGAVKIMESEYDIKPASGILTSADDLSEKEFVLIERYDNQFKTLNKPVYLFCIDSKNLENCHLLEINKVENLYDYLLKNPNFSLYTNDNFEMKSWLDIPLLDFDIIQKYFLENLNTPKKIRIQNINRLKEIIPQSIDIIKKLESFIFKMPIVEAQQFLQEQLKEGNYDLYDNVKLKKREYSGNIKKLTLKIFNKKI